MDAFRARQRLSYLLSSVILHPTRMPPSAVLVVRLMQDPLPGAIADQFAAASLPNPAWEKAARARLGVLCAEAARPARSTPPPSTEAVLFADYSELLACLALDLGTGTGVAWWWTSILRRHLAGGFTTQSDAWPRAWAEHPLYVPAAMQLLHERNQAARVLQRITAPQAWQLLRAVSRAFGLADPPTEGATAFANTAGRSPDTPLTRPDHSSTETGTPGTHKHSGAPPERAQRVPSGPHHMTTSPWEPYLATHAVPYGLGIEQHALLGLSLLLHRAPTQAASAHFAPRFRSWLAQERSRANTSAEYNTGSARRSSAAGTITVQQCPAVQIGDADMPIQLSPSSRQDGTGPPNKPGTARNQTSPNAAAQAEPGTHQQPPSIPAANSNGASAPNVQDDTDDASSALQEIDATDPQIQFEGGCPTSLGGIFYLTHLLLRSDLILFDVNLRGWALLELLARCLLYHEWKTVADDTIWEALALLDLREANTHPGADLTAQTTYAAPETWLRGLQPSKRYARFRHERLELWHHEGFLTLDTTEPGRAASCTRITPELRRRFRRDASVCASGLDLTPELRRFLHFLLPYVRWRLRRALGETNLTDVLRCPATLYVTHSHVDLVMGMNQISLPARIAGLDADPGWTPELGRVIKFHFVDRGAL